MAVVDEEIVLMNQLFEIEDDFYDKTIQNFDRLDQKIDQCNKNLDLILKLLRDMNGSNESDEIHKCDGNSPFHELRKMEDMNSIDSPSPTDSIFYRGNALLPEPKDEESITGEVLVEMPKHTASSEFDDQQDDKSMDAVCTEAHLGKEVTENVVCNVFEEMPKPLPIEVRVSLFYSIDSTIEENVGIYLIKEANDEDNDAKIVHIKDGYILDEYVDPKTEANEANGSEVPSLVSFVTHVAPMLLKDKLLEKATNNKFGEFEINLSTPAIEANTTWYFSQPIPSSFLQCIDEHFNTSEFSNHNHLVFLFDPGGSFYALIIWSEGTRLSPSYGKLLNSQDVANLDFEYLDCVMGYWMLDASVSYKKWEHEHIFMHWFDNFQRKIPWQDELFGTQCPVPSKYNGTFNFQVSDQIGCFSCLFFLKFHRASGGFGITMSNNRENEGSFVVPASHLKNNVIFRTLCVDRYIVNSLLRNIAGSVIPTILCAEVRVKHVYAIEFSSITYIAKQIVEKNAFSNVITIIMGEVEDIELPIAHMDMITSERMRYLLFYEKMVSWNDWTQAPSCALWPQALSCAFVDGWTVTIASVGNLWCILDPQGGMVFLLTFNHKVKENVEESKHVNVCGCKVGWICVLEVVRQVSCVAGLGDCASHGQLVLGSSFSQYLMRNQTQFANDGRRHGNEKLKQGNVSSLTILVMGTEFVGQYLYVYGHRSNKWFVALTDDATSLESFVWDPGPNHILEDKNVFLNGKEMSGPEEVARYSHSRYSR